MEYQKVITDVRGAIKSDKTNDDKWKAAGESVRKFYSSEAAITEVKAQFLADAIIPELDKKHRDALSRELPRKNSKEYAEFCAAHGAAAWDVAMRDKKDARATAHTYFSRVVGHAFPPVKEDKAPEAPKTLETKIAELINDAIGKCEKAEAPAFDVAGTLVHLRAARALVTK